MEGPQQQQRRRRRRPALSCWDCRRRKVKCDRNEPCAHCVRQNTQCIFKVHGNLNEPDLVTGTGTGNNVAIRSDQLSPDQGDLPQASTASLSASTPLSESHGYAGASSQLGKRARASAHTVTHAQKQLEVLAKSTASFTDRRNESIFDQHQHASQGSHSSPPREAPSSAAQCTTTGHNNTGVLDPGSEACNGVRGLPSSFPRPNTGQDALRESDSRLSDIIQRIQRLEESSSTIVSTDANVDGLASSLQARSEIEGTGEGALVGDAQSRLQIGQQEWQVVLNKPRDLGRSRQMGGAPDFAAIIACYSAMMGHGSEGSSVHKPEITVLVAQAGDFIRKCKNIARRLKVGRPSRGLPSMSTASGFDIQLVPPSREVADAMANLYFESFESTHRVLHAPTFWADYQRYWDHPETVTNDLRLKVLLVIAIGSSLYDHGDSNAALRNVEMVQPWIYAAETWLAGPLEKDRLDIGGLQIYCLNIMARQIFSIGGDLIWMSMGSLIHRAMQIGLHREPKHLPAVSVFQGELRRRLWATILDMVVQASLDALMPPRISFDEFDIEPPSNINDDEMDEFTVRILPHPKTTFTATSVQLALLDSLPVRLRIVQLLNGLQSKLSYSRVLSLSSELTDALRICSSLSTMKGQDQDHNDNSSEKATSIATPFHRNLLDYLVRRFMIPLHFFFSNQARSNPLFHYSLKLSLDAALALVSPEPDASGTFSRLMATGGGLFREGLRCAITAISLELLAHVGAQQQNGTLHRAPQHRDMLKRAVRDLMALSEERIRHGETNVKSYMFLSMVLAQVEAVEAGVDIELAIARSAKDSLGFCHEILRERADTVTLASPVAEEGENASVGEGVDSAMPGSMGFEAYGMDLDWEFFLPNAGFS